jgi:hypothetical protein
LHRPCRRRVFRCGSAAHNPPGHDQLLGRDREEMRPVMPRHPTTQTGPGASASKSSTTAWYLVTRADGRRRKPAPAGPIPQ